jgi:hypothetical protein
MATGPVVAADSSSRDRGPVDKAAGGAGGGGDGAGAAVAAEEAEGAAAAIPSWWARADRADNSFPTAPRGAVSRACLRHSQARRPNRR